MHFCANDMKQFVFKSGKALFSDMYSCQLQTTDVSQTKPLLLCSAQCQRGISQSLVSCWTNIFVCQFWTECWSASSSSPNPHLHFYLMVAFSFYLCFRPCQTRFFVRPVYISIFFSKMMYSDNRYAQFSAVFVLTLFLLAHGKLTDFHL